MIDETGDIFPELKARELRNIPFLNRKGSYAINSFVIYQMPIGEVKSELNQQVATREVYAYLDDPEKCVSRWKSPLLRKNYHQL